MLRMKGFGLILIFSGQQKTPSGKGRGSRGLNKSLFQCTSERLGGIKLREFDVGEGLLFQ